MDQKESYKNQKDIYKILVQVATICINIQCVINYRIKDAPYQNRPALISKEEKLNLRYSYFC